MTHYDTLQVARTASQEVIEVAWKTLMKLHHPDAEHGNEDLSRRLNEAHDVLGTPDKRRAYDETLRPQRMRMPKHTPKVDESAFPPAYPGIRVPRFDVNDLYQEFVSEIDLPGVIMTAVEKASQNLLGRIIRENPIIGHVLDAAQTKAKEQRKK